MSKFPLYRRLSSAARITGLMAAAFASHIIPASAAGAPLPGYFQTQNVRWGLEPQMRTRIMGQEGMHFSPYSDSAANPGMSTSFFPQTDIKLDALTELSLQMYIPSGSTCGGGSARMVVMLDDGAGRTPIVNIYSDQARACALDQWVTLNYMDPASTEWRLDAALGGGVR